MANKYGSIIFAPHVDDEIIGCWRYLKPPCAHTKVFYFYELSATRRREAFESSLALGFDISFEPTEKEILAHVESAFIVLVPSRKDSHADHKKINAKYRHLATSFYSVDMVDALTLPEKEAKDKLDVLNKYYPSQAELWQSNAKYYLFESVHKTDYDSYSTWTFLDNNEVIGNLKITVKTEYKEQVSAALDKLHAVGCYSLSHLMDIALSNAPSGKVIITDPVNNIRLEA
jgi:LmbE family N-acetylglucosaminyl deacetylase